LAGKGFTKIYNLSGGIRAWGKEVAVGPEDSGLHLFTQMESAVDAVVIGFGLEMGLRDFYTSMQSQVTSAGAKALFAKLADIEILHQERLVQLYGELTGATISVVEFGARIAEPAMEGGLTTEEYLRRYHAYTASELDVLALALSIEAQALDLYLRAAGKSDDPGAQKVLRQIAEEERSHIARLGHFIDNRQDMP